MPTRKIKSIFMMIIVLLNMISQTIVFAAQNKSNDIIKWQMRKLVDTNVIL